MCVLPTKKNNMNEKPHRFGNPSGFIQIDIKRVTYDLERLVVSMVMSLRNISLPKLELVQSQKVRFSRMNANKFEVKQA